MHPLLLDLGAWQVTSLLGFAIGFALLPPARRKPPAGWVLTALICTWGVQRSAVELVRHHADTEIWLRVGGQAVSVYQAVALGLILVGGVGWPWCVVRTAVWDPSDTAQQRVPLRHPERCVLGVSHYQLVHRRHVRPEAAPAVPATMRTSTA